MESATPIVADGDPAVRGHPRRRRAVKNVTHALTEHRPATGHGLRLRHPGRGRPRRTCRSAGGTRPANGERRHHHVLRTSSASTARSRSRRARSRSSRSRRRRRRRARPYALSAGSQTLSVTVGLEGSLDLTEIEKTVVLRLTGGSRTSAVSVRRLGRVGLQRRDRLRLQDAVPDQRRRVLPGSVAAARPGDVRRDRRPGAGRPDREGARRPASLPARRTTGRTTTWPRTRAS